MIGAVHNRTENVAFRARLSRKTIIAVNEGIRDLSRRGIDVSAEENQFHLIKKELAATGKPGTFMLKHDKNGAFMQYEATNSYDRAYLPLDIQDKMIISGDVVKFPPSKLDRLAEFLKEFYKKQCIR